MKNNCIRETIGHYRKLLSPTRHFTFLWGNGRTYNDYMCLDVASYHNVKIHNEFIIENWKERRKNLIKSDKKNGRAEFGKMIIKELGLVRWSTNYLIFSEDYAQRVEWDYLRKLGKRYKIKTVLYINDPIDVRLTESGLKKYQELVDLIVTTDSSEAEKYGLCFFPLIYSKVKDTIPRRKKTDFDIMFIGRDKNRREIIDSIKHNAKSRKLNTYIKILEGDYNKRERKENWIEYGELIDFVQRSNCLLEVVQKNQNAVTLRTMEALVYGKKLLTNNDTIKCYPFYDERYIHVFHDLKDIDYSFIKKREKVKYNYHNDYSPINLLDMIIKKLEGKDC